MNIRYIPYRYCLSADPGPFLSIVEAGTTNVPSFFRSRKDMSAIVLLSYQYITVYFSLIVVYAASFKLLRFFYGP
jgi:hypothetical protein